MVFLEKKKLKGHTYWYASERNLVDGKIKRTWQEYLGTTESIIECMRKSKELPIRDRLRHTIDNYITGHHNFSTCGGDAAWQKGYNNQKYQI